MTKNRKPKSNTFLKGELNPFASLDLNAEWMAHYNDASMEDKALVVFALTAKQIIAVEKFLQSNFTING